MSSSPFIQFFVHGEEIYLYEIYILVTEIEQIGKENRLQGVAVIDYTRDGHKLVAKKWKPKEQTATVFQ